MSYVTLPSRIDQEVMAGTNDGFEFVILGDAGPINISADTIEMRISDSDGVSAVLMKSNGPGAHSDGPNGKTQFVFTPVELRTGSRSVRRWWYQVSRVTATTLKRRVHIVGELRVLPSLE